MMSPYSRFGVPTVVNACGTVTRLGGGGMHPEVLEAMRQASMASVDMLALQAGASRSIARATGAEAGIVTCGASAALLLGAAACLTGLDPARMNSLPDAGESANEFIIVRSQRNMYDRAIRTAGGQIVEVGIPDRFSGPGVRDAATWEIEAAISPRTAAICWLAQPQSLPPLPEITAVARPRNIPVLVDAAAQLPPRDSLRRFIVEGADLVAFSGGKAIGGPQASGILCGRADLVTAALVQMLDMDMLESQLRIPDEFARLRQMPGLPHHGIGRSCKTGKEEIVGMLVALETFVATDEGQRRRAWKQTLQTIASEAGPNIPARVTDAPIPVLEITTPVPEALARFLAASDPPILCSLARARDGLLLILPTALRLGEDRIIGARLRAWADKTG